MGSHTTFADVDSIKTQIEKGRSHLQEILVEVNKARGLAPNRELRDYIGNISKYIKSVGMSFDVTEKALSSGDMEKMKQAVDQTKKELLNIDGIKQQREEIITQFEITP